LTSGELPSTRDEGFISSAALDFPEGSKAATKTTALAIIVTKIIARHFLAI
jgi:hypothetical protein